MKYYIYKIENIINHKVYIGLTNNIPRRWGRHLSGLRRGVHDNKFLQSEFDKYGESNFEFSQVICGDYTDKEIGDLERKYIKEYDSYYNGYNQNEGGNFRATNGGTKLIVNDILKILAMLEFSTKSGQTLGDMFGVTRTQIARIKKGENHMYAQNLYHSMSYNERKALYEECISNEDIRFDMLKSNKKPTNRKLTKEQVFMVLLNNERKIMTRVGLAKLLGLKSAYTLDCIIKNITYKDYAYEYSKLLKEDKDKIAELFSNE